MAGRFGCGKTEIAVNGALEVARRGERVTLVDLDLVKPYFRCRALHSIMAGGGVRVVTPDGEALTPSPPLRQAEVCGALSNNGSKVIIDAGGDPVGMLAFGRVADAIPAEDVEHLLVLNFSRPQTDTVQRAVALVRAIEAVARLRVTGLVANTHLLGDTTPETVRRGLRLTVKTAAIIGLPVAFAAVEERLVGAFPPDWAPCPVLPLRRMVFPPFEAPADRSDGEPAMFRSAYQLGSSRGA
jgi:hypothetical protein